MLFLTNFNLKRHQETKHKQHSDKTLGCEFCGKSFLNEFTLKRHHERIKDNICPGSRNTDNKENHCNICDKVLMNKDSLRVHNAEYHTGPTKCKICGIVLSTKTALKR